MKEGWFSRRKIASGSSCITPAYIYIQPYIKLLRQTKVSTTNMGLRASEIKSDGPAVYATSPKALRLDSNHSKEHVLLINLQATVIWFNNRVSIYQQCYENDTAELHKTLV